MLKKVMAMLASKYMAIKVRIRAVETHLMIQSLLLRDKKMVRHLFHRRKCFKNRNQPDSTEAFISNSVATTTPASLVQVAEEMEDDDVYPHSPSEDDPDPDPEEFHQGSVHPKISSPDCCRSRSNTLIPRFGRHHPMLPGIHEKYSAGMSS